MSWVWNVVLSFSDEEFWDEGEEAPRDTCEPLERINAWIPHGRLVDLAPPTYEQGAGAGMTANLWGGGFKHLDIEAFLAVVDAQPWNNRAAVQVWLKGEESDSFYLFELSPA